MSIKDTCIRFSLWIGVVGFEFNTICDSNTHTLKSYLICFHHINNNQIILLKTNTLTPKEGLDSKSHGLRKKR